MTLMDMINCLLNLSGSGFEYEFSKSLFIYLLTSLLTRKLKKPQKRMTMWFKLKAEH